MAQGYRDSVLGPVKVDKIEVAAYDVPTDQPESDGTLQWDATTLVVVHVHGGRLVDLGYTYADVAAAKLIDVKLREVIEGSDAMNVENIWRELRHSVQNLGQKGLTAMAISAVDIALWDLKARILGLPLVKLLGQERGSVMAYGSGGFTSYDLDTLRDQLSSWADSGMQAIKMKVGRHPGDDMRRVAAAREAVGPDVEIFVDANGAYLAKEALLFMERFREFGVTWMEEPVSSDALNDLRLVRYDGPAGMEVAAGKYGFDLFYFRRMLEAKAVDVLQVDATRCGGITGYLQAAILADAFGTPVSAHTAPSLHTHLGCATERSRHIEYFHDHVRIEGLFFDGAREHRDGRLAPDLSAAGIGMTLKKRDAERYRM